MLRVLYQLKMEGKSFRWLVVGAGREEYEARLRQQTEHPGMSGDVLMAGALFPALPVYRIASVVVMPSENEAFGMVLAEASVSGVPVIASETGGIPDVIQKNVTGTLLPVGMCLHGPAHCAIFIPTGTLPDDGSQRQRRY